MEKSRKQKNGKQESGKKKCKIRKWELIINFISAITLLINVTTSNLIQIKNLDYQAEIKKYEVTFIEKQKIYTELMSNVTKVFYAAVNNSRSDLTTFMGALELSYFQMEPYFDSETDRLDLFEIVKEYGMFCYNICDGTNTYDDYSDRFREFQMKYRDIFFNKLFKQI